MNEILALALTLGMMLLVYQILLRPRSRWGAFNPARARMRASRGSAGNSLLMLTAVNLATLGWELITQAGALHTTAAIGVVPVLVVVLLVSLLALLVVAKSLADLLIGLAGVAAALTGAYLNGGLAAVLAILVLSMITVFLLGAARGFLRPR